MKREARRVRLARRQVLLARVSERTAMRSLAEALSEADRSEAIAVRSKALFEDYGARCGGGDGASLADLGRFSGALAALERDASKARDDAAQQASWQARTLSEAQTTAQRHNERLEKALGDYDRAREQRAAIEQPPAPSRSVMPKQSRLARDVQGEVQQQLAERDEQSPSQALAQCPYRIRRIAQR